MSFSTIGMDFDKSSIERLKRTLYSRDEKLIPKEKRTPVEGHEIDAPTNWGQPKSFDISYEEVKKKNNSFFNKFLIGSLVFFVVSLGVALFIFFGGINMISSNNLDIKIVAPSSVSSGEEFDMGLSVVNANRTDLEEASLFIDYPDGSEAITVNSSNPPAAPKILSHEQINLGTIARGSSSDYTIRTLLFGEKDVIKRFTLRIEYKVKGSNAVFSKEKTYDVSISSSPLLLSVDYPKEINSGQEVKISIDVTSNSSVVMKDTLIKIDYPYGFTYKNSNVKPLRDNAVWNIGDLKNGDKKNLTVTGVLVGQNMEDRSFRITSGTQSPNTKGDFSTTLTSSLATIGIRKSFFDLGIVSTYGEVSHLGQSLPLTIKWQNTLPDKILNSHIEGKLSGNVLDRSAVLPGNGGFYRSLDNTVLWDKNSTKDLIEIIPGDGSQISLSLASFPSSEQTKLIKNPYVDLQVVMTGDRSGLDAGQVSSSADINIKIESVLGFSARSYRSFGPFVNSGSIPPRADKESTYTITWTLTNTANDLKDTLVSGLLPPGVEWKGEVSPSSERISFDPSNRTVSWSIGNTSAGAGFTYSPKEVSFKVGIIPNVNQIGGAPDLVSKMNASATDTYTNTQIVSSVQSVTTQYSDPGSKTGDGTVVK